MRADQQHRRREYGRLNAFLYYCRAIAAAARTKQQVARAQQVTGLALGQRYPDRLFRVQQIGVVDVLHLKHGDFALRVVLKARPEGVTHLYFS